MPGQSTQTGCRQTVVAQDAPEILLLTATEWALEVQRAASVPPLAIVAKLVQELERQPPPHWRE